MRLWIERFIYFTKHKHKLGQPRMRLWIERWKKCTLFRWKEVSLVWGCELKVSPPFTFSGWDSVSLVWGCELKVYTPISVIMQLLVSLVWGCELKVGWFRFKRDWCMLVSLVWGCELKGLWEFWRSASRVVSLVWGCELKVKKRVLGFQALAGSASYEAVNWKEMIVKIINSNIKRSASYEAVNWKITALLVLLLLLGQPRMRLWIESHKIPFPLTKPSMVSLVWGCELKDTNRIKASSNLRVSLVWGCELKD